MYVVSSRFSIGTFIMFPDFSHTHTYPRKLCDACSEVSLGEQLLLWGWELHQVRQLPSQAML